MRLATRVAWIAAWTIALISSPSNALAQDGCIADLNDDGVVNGTDLAIVIGGWGPCPVNTTFVGGVVKAGGVPVPGAMVTTDLGGKTVAGEGGIFLLEIELPSVIETVVLSATAEIGGVGFEGTKTVSPVDVGGSNLVGLIEVSSGGCDGGSTWTAGPGDANFDGPVRCIIECDLGDGPRLFVGGEFTSVNGIPITALAMWDGSAWSHVGAQFAGSSFGIPTSVRAMVVYDNGTGPALYVGGSFLQIGSTIATALARWDGKNWTTPEGYPELPQAIVNALVIHDFGPDFAGPGVVAGGRFGDTGTFRAWIGSPNTSSFFWTNGEVNALASHQGQLFLGGRFGLPGSNQWSGVAVMPSFSQSLVTPTPLLGPNDSVSALAATGNGKGTDVYVAGRFSMIDSGGAVASNIVRWNVDPTEGWRWFTLGTGTNAPVDCLFGVDQGEGFRLLAGGEFTQAGNAVAFRIAEWNGQLWSPLGSGLDGPALGLFATPDIVTVGGGFSAAGSVTTNGLAQWGCITP